MMTAASRQLQAITSLVIALIGIAMLIIALDYPAAARLIPSIAGVTMVILALIHAVQLWRTPLGTPERPDAEGDVGGLTLVTDPMLLGRSAVIIIASGAILLVIPLFGYAIATSAYVLGCLLFLARMRFLPALAIAAANFLSVYIFLELVAGIPAVGGAWIPTM